MTARLESRFPNFAPSTFLYPTQAHIVPTITVQTKATTMYVEMNHKVSKRCRVLGIAGEKTLITFQAMVQACVRRWQREGQRVAVVAEFMFAEAAAIW